MAKNLISSKSLTSVSKYFLTIIKVMSLHELRQTLQYYLTELLFKKWQLLSC